MSTIYDIPVEKIDGTPASLQDFSGSVLLVVNVASKCGLTPQYAGLESLYQEQKHRGLVIVGFPANNFGSQEPGENAEIAQFCSLTYGVSFPMFAKISVKGADRHPLYDRLTAAKPLAYERDGSFREKLAGHGVTQDDPSDVLWNFEKFLIARDGAVVARFGPDTAPTDPQLLAAIEKELSAQI